MRARFLAVAAVAALAVVGGACGSASGTVSKRLVVMDSPPRFNHATITATRGSEVDLLVRNDTGRVRDFSISGYDKYVQGLQPDKPVRVRFKAKRSGTFEISSDAAGSEATARLVVPA